MTAERWRRIEEVFQAALEVSASERRRYLDSACNGDETLRTEVESLLAHEPGADDLIHSAVKQAHDSVARAPTPTDNFLGRRIGSYRLLFVIGRGGMGTVYRAIRADDQYEKQVAIKVVKRGMDTDYVLTRFRHERQILAKLEHQRIARMLDGGTTDDGLPYFVMELIDGVPITEYCTVNKVSIPDRLKLFRFVCTAVQYAHQNLIVHRD